jgi:hypothetical protein
MPTSWHPLLNKYITLDLSGILRLMAWNAIFGVRARQEHVIQQYVANTAVFAACCFLVTMGTRTVEALTGLGTWEDLVHTFGVTPCLAAMTTPGKTPVARNLAPSFRTKLGKVVPLVDLDLGSRVSRATEA